MSATVAVLNLALGAVYVSIGTMALIDLKRGWRTAGFSHFGAGFIGLAYTCGPHHFAHGVHVAFEGRTGGALDLVAVLFGLPAGAAFALLRTEAFRGGRGDRFIGGTPRWIAATPTVSAMYLTAMVAAAIGATSGRALRVPSTVLPNVLLVGIYAMIGYFLLRTQVRNRRPLGGWSVSGCSLMGVFPTCALMHAVFVLYAVTGVYAYDIHALAIDWVSVPTGLYFLWAVRALYRDALRDWNRPAVRQPSALAG